MALRPVAAIAPRSHMGVIVTGAPMDQRSTPERPRSEPEILPPERTGPRPHDRWERMDAAGGYEGAYRVRVAKLGPVQATLLAIAIGVVSAVLLMLVLGSLLI